MKVADKHVVRFHYDLKDVDGELLESSKEHDAIAYLHGHKGILPGLADAMADKVVGDEISVTLEAPDAYGEIKPDSQQRIPVKHLQGPGKWKKGMIAAVQTEKGQRQVTIVKMGKFMVTIDTNHPLAGKTLTFEITIDEVRPATEEELTHGHAHGAGGHQH
ncbi:MAG: peptidylprolyl isomerase [Algicola sp.]|nr:peptidylprolyl isomerase [Algicola sp.]